MIYKDKITLNENVAEDRPVSERYTFAKEKTTPNELAKDIVWGVLDNAGYWEENSTWNQEDMTEREKQQVRDMVQKQVQRVARFLKG